MLDHHAVVRGLDQAGFPRIGHRALAHIRFGLPGRPDRHFVLVPLDPTAPEYAQLLRAALTTIRRLATDGTSAQRALTVMAGPLCTGLTARWCPVHGNCACDDDGDLNNPTCPLHSKTSSHAEHGEGEQ